MSKEAKQTDVEERVAHGLKFRRKQNIKPSDVNALSIDNSIIEKYNDLQFRWCDAGVARQQELQQLGYIPINGTDIGIENSLLQPERSVDKGSDHRQILMAIPKDYDQKNQQLVSERGRMSLVAKNDDAESAYEIRGSVKTTGGLVNKSDMFQQ